MITVWPFDRVPPALLRPLWIIGGVAAGGLVAGKLALSVHQLVTVPAPAVTAAASPTSAPAAGWAKTLPAPAAGPEALSLETADSADAEPGSVPPVTAGETAAAAVPTEPAAGVADGGTAGGDGEQPQAAAPFDPRAPLVGAAPPPGPLDPERLTRRELDILQSLGERRGQLDRRAAELDQQAALVTAAEARLEAQMEQLEALRTEIAAMIAQHDQTEDAKLASLVKIYETMKPKAAAEIFNRLEMPILIQMIARMRETKSADVLARMEPVKAKQVTAALAARIERLRAAEAEGS